MGKLRIEIEKLKPSQKRVNTSQKIRDAAQEPAKKICDSLRKNPRMSIKELAKMVGLSEAGVKYHLKKLKNEGLIERIGADRGGYWKVK